MYVQAGYYCFALEHENNFNATAVLDIIMDVVCMKPWGLQFPKKLL